MPARVSTTRRGALSGALGLVVLTACDVDDLRPPEDEAEPTPSATTGTAEPPTPDADSVLVERMVGEILAAKSVVGTARKFPRLKTRLGPLTAMHRAHIRVLATGSDGLGFATAQIDPANAGDALEQVRTAERSLQQTLATGAVEARSGALARLLASMSASVSQHLVALDAAP